MARARNIKPGFFRNADLAELSVEARLLFIGLWTMADREGRLEDRPKQIKMEIYPADNFDCGPLLDGLESFGFIKRYVAGGKRCIQVINFVIHQMPHGTEKDSELPDENGYLTVNDRAKGGYVTGKFELKPCSPPLDNVRQPSPPPVFNVNPPLDNALNPESGFLNPESNTPQPPKGADVDPEKQKSKEPEFTAGFLKFWEMWPTNDRKQARGKCFEAWKKASAERDAALVLAHVSSLKNSSWLKDGGQFVPAPLVYLNQRRWEGAETDGNGGYGGSTGAAWEGAK